MSNRPYCLVSAVVFIIVGLAHAWRAATSTAILVGTWTVPIAASWVAAVVALGLAVWGLRSAPR